MDIMQPERHTQPENPIAICPPTSTTVKLSANYAADVETREPILSNIKSSIFLSFNPIAESTSLDDILSGVNSPSS